MSFELEFRSVFKKEKYEKLYHFLHKNAVFLGKDDKEIHFFILPQKIIKVTKNIIKNTAKITYKDARIGKGDIFEEIEIEIDIKNIEKYIEFFIKTLEGFEYQFVQNLRDNFKIGKIELALKYSNTWGYHLELERILDSKNNQEKATKEIYQLAEKLGVKILNKQELEIITQKIDKNYKLGKYKSQKLPMRPQDKK